MQDPKSLAILQECGVLSLHSINDHYTKFSYILAPYTEIDFSSYVNEEDLQIPKSRCTKKVLIDCLRGDDFLFVYAFSSKDSRHFIFSYNLSKTIHVSFFQIFFLMFNFCFKFRDTGINEKSKDLQVNLFINHLRYQQSFLKLSYYQKKGSFVL